MKNFFILFFVCFAVLGLQSYAQKGKFGHVFYQEILMAMPERDSAELKMQSFAKELQEALETMQVDMNNKINDYDMNSKLPVGDAKRWSDVIRSTKESEIQDLQKRIQTFQGTAQNSLQKKEQELLDPIEAKVKKAIKDIGKDNGLIYVLPADLLLYYSEESVDITPLVKTKLGVK